MAFNNNLAMKAYSFALNGLTRIYQILTIRD